MSTRPSRGTARRRDTGSPRTVERHVPADWTAGLPVFVPQGYEPGYDYPLLVWLPDPAGRPFDLGRAMTRTSLRNFVAVQPRVAVGGAGAEGVWRAIDRVSSRLSVHPRRTYLIGQGAGGTAAFRIACREPESFAGVVSLGGSFPLDEGLFARIDALRRLPMLHCCRSADVASDAAAIDRTLRLFHAAGATLALRIYPGGKDLSRSRLADVNRWIMEDVCGSAASLQTHGVT
jgi:phospholipase/carboxylesterase